MLISIVIAGVLFFVFCLIAKTRLKDGLYNMDANGERGAFEPHLARYQKFAELLITLSAGAVAFIVNTLLSEPKPCNRFQIQFTWGAPLAMTWFGLAILSAVVFIIYLSYTYEGYSHRKNKEESNYNSNQYAVVLALAAHAACCFFAGCVVIGFNLHLWPSSHC